MQNGLVGTWSLLEWCNIGEDGSRVCPLGEDATGLLHYGADGFMFVHMTAAHRQRFASNDPFGGTTAEDSAAMKSQIAYAGRYEFRGDHVLHRIAQASCPNWAGAEQTRRVALDGDRLRLSAEGLVMQGRRVTVRLDWQRAAG